MQVRARDLFYGLWVNDLFMERVEANAEWSLFCPNEAPGLADTWGAEFEALYHKFERSGRAKRVIKAQQLWFAILEAQVRLYVPLCSVLLRCQAPAACQHVAPHALQVNKERDLEFQTSAELVCAISTCKSLCTHSKPQLQQLHHSIVSYN